MKKILEMKSIIKEFPGVKALDDVNLTIGENEIHSICGENGAGKSTLMKVLSGVYPSGTYGGDIIFCGEKCEFKDIKESENLGIVIIHQELALSPYLSIAENLFLGNERVQNGILDWYATYTDAKKYLDMVGLDEDPKTILCEIGVGKQQLVEIAKALTKDVKLLILDEPTAALNEKDSKNLLDLLINLKSQGISSIIISHKLNEITYVSDKITIIRDGKSIETLEKTNAEIDEEKIVKLMVGRDISDRYPKRNVDITDILFEIKNWTVMHNIHTHIKAVDDVSLNVRRGEVVGISGLMGAGRTELAMSIFGKAYGKYVSGKIFKDGKEINIKSEICSIKNGIAYVTEDRKTSGLILSEDITYNISLANLSRVSKSFLMDKHKEEIYANEYLEKLKIRAPGIWQKTGNLSGGNQQKVLLGKWIFTEPDILILDEPTRGIDVGAKYEIYSIINELAKSGKGVIIISSELPEILGMCDRTYVMCEGKIVGELSGEQSSQESIMSCIMQASRGSV